MAIKEEKKPIAPRLKMMEVGDKESYPITSLMSVRSLCTNIGLQMGRVFKTALDRAEGIITVERVE